MTQAETAVWLARTIAHVGPRKGQASVCGADTAEVVRFLRRMLARATYASRN